MEIWYLRNKITFEVISRFKVEQTLTGRKVALEVGHGWRIRPDGTTFFDPGCSADGGGPNEHELGTFRAGIIKNKLEAMGVFVEIFDQPISVTQLWRNVKGFDVFLSLHLNSFNQRAQGTETLIHPHTGQESHKFADLIQQSLVEVLGLPDRGVKLMRLAVLSGLPADLPACLSEAFFLDSLKGRSPWDLSEISAGAISVAIAKYLEGINLA